MQGGADAGDDEDEDEDEEYQEEHGANGMASIGVPPAAVTGTKRGRNDEEEEEEDPQIEGDYGELEGNGDIVTKRARTSGEEA